MASVASAERRCSGWVEQWSRGRRWKRGIPLDINGRPTRWKHAAREVNPEALRRYPVLTDDDLADLCYSTLDGETVTGNKLIDRRRMANTALRNMRDQT